MCNKITKPKQLQSMLDKYGMPIRRCCTIYINGIILR